MEKLSNSKPPLLFSMFTKRAHGKTAGVPLYASGGMVFLSNG